MILLMLFLFASPFIIFPLLVWWAHRGEHGFQPGPLSRKRDVVDKVPYQDTDGNSVENIFCITFGGYQRSPGLSTIRIMGLMISQRLYFSMAETGERILILDDLKDPIGFYPPEGPYYDELCQRLQRKEIVDAWVYDIGLDRNSYYCEVKVVVYHHEKATEPETNLACILCGNPLKTDNEFHTCPICVGEAETFFRKMLEEIARLEKEANQAGRDGNIQLQRDRLQEILSWLYRYRTQYFIRGFRVIKEDVDEEICQVEHAYREAERELREKDS